MRGDVVVLTATPRTCATTPVDCSPHDTFDPANAGSIAFLVNSKLADDCVSKLDFATRTAYLAKLKEGFSNNAGGTMDVKKATIRLLQFVALTDQQRQLNDYLANNNLHYWYVDNLSGEDLYAYAAIAGQRVYTFNTNRSDLPTANENRNFSSLSLGLFGNTNIAKIVNNKFEFTTYGKDYEHPNGSTYPLIQLWNNSVAANQYVYLHFEDNFTLAGFSYQKGINYPVPGVLAYAIFNKNKWNNVQAGTQIGFDVASLAFGVGELKALYSAANYASNTYKIYRLTKSFMDFGVTIGDVIISNNLTGNFTQAQQDRWNRFCFLYFTASLSAEGAEALLKWKGKTITKSSDFETMMDEVLVVGVGKAALLTKFENFTNLKAWINTLNDVADANLLSKLDNLESSYFSKLDADLFHTTYGPEIKALLKESPDDLADVWKRLKNDPAYSWEIQKTGGSRWEKWSQREFFKDITAKGKGFETDVCLAAFKNRSSAKYLELKQKFQTDFGKNLDDYDMYSQVQLKYDGENYFVADQLFVKRNIDGDIVDMVVIENKLSSTTPLTTPQSTAFTKTSFTVRSISIESSTTPGKFLNSGQGLNFSGTKQWYKVHDGANGDVISGINKMN